MTNPPIQLCCIELLPDELISDILIAAVNPDSEFDFNRKPKSIRLAQLVCQRWKFVTCSTPALWTTLNLPCTRSKHLQLYLKRSGVLLLEVQLAPITAYYDRRFISDDIFAERVRALGAVIHGFSERIWKLEMRGSSAWEANQYVVSLPANLPNLRELAIHCGRADNGYSLYHLDLVTPQLRSLTVQAYCLHWRHMPLAPKLERLHIIEARSTRVAHGEFGAVLQAYPALQELVLDKQFIEDFHGNQTVESLHPVVLRMLETLELGSFSHRQLEGIFSILAAPTLKVLRLKENRGLGQGRATGMRIPPLPGLERLTMCTESSIVVEFARRAPSVKHLVFIRHRAADRWETVDHAFVSLVSHWRKFNYPLPLETLKTEGVRPGSILSLLGRGREKMVPSLRKVAIHYTDTFLSKNEEDFVAQAEARTRLSDLVKLEIYGLSHEALGGRETVDSWVKEQRWLQVFRVSHITSY